MAEKIWIWNNYLLCSIIPQLPLLFWSYIWVFPWPLRAYTSCVMRVLYHRFICQGTKSILKHDKMTEFSNQCKSVFAGEYCHFVIGEFRIFILHICSRTAWQKGQNSMAGKWSRVLSFCPAGKGKDSPGRESPVREKKVLQGK